MLVRKMMGFTISQAREMGRLGFILRLVSLGAGDKDFYDVYVQ